MASKNVVELNQTNFQEIVFKSDKPVLVDFWAEWCGPCKQLSPLIDQLADEQVGKAVICKVNVDQSQELAGQFQINAIPTILIFQGGRMKEQIVGLTSKKDLESKLGL